MDNFGFQNQGNNYEKFRPKYPKCLYDYSLDKIKAKNNYLDIAMGTGQLLFNIAPQFNQSKGIDISNKMLQVANSILLQDFPNLKGKIRISKCDIMHLENTQKFDFVTVGQALHWFPVKETLLKIKNILEPQGRLLVLSYVVKAIQGKSQNIKYQNFYNKIKPYFDFDRNQLHNHYNDKEKYPFQQIFPKVIRFSQQVKVEMDQNAYISYLKTYSGYNQYLLKSTQTQDPIKQIQTSINKPLTVIFDYFKIQCGL